ncbi:DUF6415 family natural product biosynthesis protein [Streptomyces violascens]|uniref:DUF6415 family natural product biosynthesis protein n=1 Tax=Streptomyces violascens TaxID=67381 RepID=UPI0036A122D6
MTPQRATPTAIDMRRDIEIAMALAANCPNGAVANAVRCRLQDYITGLVEPAEAYLNVLKTETRERDIAEGTIRHARNLTRVSSGDPAARLRLLAKSVDHLLQYATTAQARRQP